MTTRLVFVPSLGSVLLAAEDRKGQPLTPEEVTKIRDRCACIALEPAVAEAFEARRGGDLDPENAWHDFQVLRRALGRKPDIDAGARVLGISRTDPDMAQATSIARSTLDELREWFRRGALSSVKTRLVDGEQRLFLWLIVVGEGDGSFVGEVFEAPSGWTAHAVGDRLTVAPEDVADWMVNVDGTLYGGWTLRVHRARLPERERAAFDERLGVRIYAEGSGAAT